MHAMPWSVTTWRATANAVLDLPFGLVVGGLVLTGIALSLGLSLLGVGLLVGVATLALAHWLGIVTRARLFAVLGGDIPAGLSAALAPDTPGRPGPATPADASFIRRVVRRLATTGPWKNVAHAL